MANIAITSTNGHIRIIFGSSSSINDKQVYIHKSGIAEIEELPNGGVFVIKNYNSLQQGYKLSFDGKNGDQVDTVEGVDVTSDEDLANKIAALMTT